RPAHRRQRRAVRPEDVDLRRHGRRARVPRDHGVRAAAPRRAAERDAGRALPDHVGVSPAAPRTAPGEGGTFEPVMSPFGLARPRHTPSRDLGDLARAFGLDVRAVPGVVLHGVSVSSRSAEPGDLFAALPGARAHGADHAAEAVGRGAVAVLTDPTGVERVRADVPVLVHPDPRGLLGEVSAWVYGHPARDLRLAAITGTNG